MFIDITICSKEKTILKAPYFEKARYGLAPTLSSGKIAAKLLEKLT